MQAHKKPEFSYQFDIDHELGNLEVHRNLPDRRVPARNSENVLIASWNLTNFGLQERERQHLEIMANILHPFDVIAFQEVADDITHLNTLISILGNGWHYLYSDIAGNRERLGFIYRTDRLHPTGLAAELAMRGYQHARIEIEGIDPEEEPFSGFNRNPYMIGFRADGFEFSLVNVHLYWSNMNWRRLEAKALGNWAKSRIEKGDGNPCPPDKDIILIGDFNMPHVQQGDPVYDELKKFGLRFPKHTTNLVGTNLAGDNDYDEIAFFPSRTSEDFTERIGVFDFDNAIFKDLWPGSVGADSEKFFQYVRYYVADHRLIWAEFKRRAQG